MQTPKHAAPTLFYLHALGSSRDEFNEIIAGLAGFTHVAIDLPGFGEASPALGTTVEEMVRYVCDRIAASGATRWMLIGHSMGGKIASIVASRALSGAANIFGLCGVILLAGSPPTPEPMEEERRKRMRVMLQAEPMQADAARAFIDANIGEPLEASRHDRAMRDLQRTTREAWQAWLERGSREDWSAEVGIIDAPVLIVVGESDGDLGYEGQRRTNARVYPRAKIVSLPNAGHLLPLERPAEVAELIARFWETEVASQIAVPESYARLIASERVGSRTRGIFARRSLPDDAGYEPQAMDGAAFATLRAVAARVVPQHDAAIDLAARLDAQLAAGAGDGWRFAELPADREAYALALQELDGFALLQATEQDKTLMHIAEGKWRSRGGLDAEQMRRWFQDACADLVRLWVAHPATMAAIGFDGFANGGDGVRKQGFQQLAGGEYEAWEPMHVQALHVKEEA